MDSSTNHQNKRAKSSASEPCSPIQEMTIELQEEQDATLTIDLMCALETSQNSLHTFHHYWSTCKEHQKELISNFLDGYITDIPTSSILNNLSLCSNMFNEWLRHNPHRITSFLTQLIQEIPLVPEHSESIESKDLTDTIQTIKEIWSISQLRTSIGEIQHMQKWKYYETTPLFYPFQKFIQSPINHPRILEAFEPIIQDHTIHDHFITLLWQIIHANIACTFSDQYSAKACSSLSFNQFILLLITKLITVHTLPHIITQISSNPTIHTIKDHKITDPTLNLPHKLIITTLYAIPICHHNILQQFRSINNQLQQMSFTSFLLGPPPPGLIAKLEHQKKIILDLLSNQEIKSMIQEVYISYDKIHTHLLIPETFHDIVNYVVAVNRFNNYKIYKYLAPDTFIILSNIMGGIYKTTDHARYDANECIHHLIPKLGFPAFGDIFTNICNYISEVDFFKFNDILKSIQHHKTNIQTLQHLLDSPIKNTNSQTTMASAIFNVLKHDFNMFDHIASLEKTIESHGHDSDLNKLFMLIFEIIILSLVIYKQFYTTNKFSTPFKEVDTKYALLVQTLIPLLASPKYILNSTLHRKDLSNDMLQIIYSTIYIRLHDMLDIFGEIKKTILDGIPFLRDKDRLNPEIEAINSALSNYTDQTLNFPDQFLDPFMCTEITDPVMIPDTNEIYDKISILTQIRESTQHPITRKPFLEEDFITYNQKPEVQQKVAKFLEEKNAWIAQQKAQPQTQPLQQLPLQEREQQVPIQEREQQVPIQEREQQVPIQEREQQVPIQEREQLQKQEQKVQEREQLQKREYSADSVDSMDSADSADSANSVDSVDSVDSADSNMNDID